MSDPHQPDPDPGSVPIPVLRREALLPTERNRGLGTVAVVCTMAGVASGLALATTLMAMQVADSMSTRAANCPYRIVETTVEPRMDHGFLGVRYVFHDGYAEIDTVLPGTPAENIRLHAGDRVLAVDGNAIQSAADLQERIYSSHAGAQPLLVIERDGAEATVRPTLVAWPTISF